MLFSLLLVSFVNISQQHTRQHRTYQAENGIDYVSLWQQFEQGKLSAQLLAGANAQRNQVSLVTYQGQKYIFKTSINDDNRFKKRIVDWVHGTFYVYCMKRGWQAHHNGSNIAPLIYLVIDHYSGKRLTHSHLIAEYVDGHSLRNTFEVEQHGEAIKQAIVELHQHKMASADLHLGNLIVSPTGIRFIDLSDRDWLCVAQCKDVMSAKRKWNLDVSPKPRFFYLLSSKERLRLWLRTLR